MKLRFQGMYKNLPGDDFPRQESFRSLRGQSGDICRFVMDGVLLTVTSRFLMD